MFFFLIFLLVDVVVCCLLVIGGVFMVDEVEWIVYIFKVLGDLMCVWLFLFIVVFDGGEVCICDFIDFVGLF